METAFLHADLKEELYMKIPEEFATDGKCWRLRKAIYGLKQSGKQWNVMIDGVLHGCGFKRCVKDPCVYVNHRIIALLYVEDLLVLSSKTQEISMLLLQLSKHVKIKDLGDVRESLGVQIVK